MKHSYFLILLLVILFSSGYAYADSTVNVFQINQLQLKVMDYPWGEELCLFIEGRANPILKNTKLLISLYYNYYPIQKLEMPINPSSQDAAIAFQNVWEPLNGAQQQILPGKYTIDVDLIVTSQSEIFQQEWAKNFGKKRPQVHSISIFIGKEEEYQEKRQKIKAFYIEKMRQLNTIFKDLQTKKEEALRVQKDVKKRKKNSFAEDGKFSPQLWWRWFQYDFLQIIQKHQEELQKYKKSVFVPLYPNTLTSMQLYADTLIRLGRLTSVDIYKAHSLQQNLENLSWIEPAGLRGLHEFVMYIRKLHIASAREMGINLKKELGYLPPPD